jgi:CheY-like chemotaxis protein
VNNKILFVDDDPSALQLYRQLLQGEFEVATALSGDEGLLVLRNEGPFFTVIADMQMPGMDGVQFLGRARDLAPNTMRVLITEKMDMVCLVNAVNDGCIFRLLVKPCQAPELKGAVSAALDRYRGRKEERVRIALPVHFRRSAPGAKLHAANTVDISNSGARLAGLQVQLETGEVLSVEFGGRRAPFRVVWTGRKATAMEGTAGLQCLAVDADIWKLEQGQLEASEPLMRARSVQRGLLPQEQPPLQTLDYAGRCIQARMVGGDYYDFLHMGAGEVGIVLADIAGKGIAAALLMASLQGSLHGQFSDQSKDLPQLLASVNLHLFKHSAADRYATLFFARYCDATRTLNYVNCGHNPPLLLRKRGEVQKLEATATVIGLFPDWNCSVAEVQLAAGDALAIYTDGITETTGRNGEEFGEKRLIEALRNSANLDSAQVLTNVENAVEQFRLGEQADDLTLVIARAR